MKLSIGANIRRLRRGREMTQEQLAQLMNVSAAAVSKWESGDSYPDITMILPLSQIFYVSTDELLGYDSVCAEKNVAEILKEYRLLRMYGKNQEASELLLRGREEYPADYALMNARMWDAAGGENRTDVSRLNAHFQELTRICGAILDGCMDDGLRAKAVNMKAKLLHASGKTEEAVALLQTLPSWGQNAENRVEQLFAEGTPEHSYWKQRNLYALADTVALRLNRSAWYASQLPLEERILRCETLGDNIIGMWRESTMTVFAVMAHMVYSDLSGQLIFGGGPVKDIVRIIKKRLTAADAVTDAARDDAPLRELLEKTYSTSDLGRWTLDILQSSEQTPYVRLREEDEFQALINFCENR